MTLGPVSASPGDDMAPAWICRVNCCALGLSQVWHLNSSDSYGVVREPNGAAVYLPATRPTAAKCSGHFLTRYGAQRRHFLPIVSTPPWEAVRGGPQGVYRMNSTSFPGAHHAGSLAAITNCWFRTKQSSVRFQPFNFVHPCFVIPRLRGRRASVRISLSIARQRA